MKKRNLQSGFTLVELMIGIGLMAIIFAVAVPSFRNTIADTILTSATNNFVAATSLARSAAIRQPGNGTTSVVAIAPAAGNEWGGGWNVLDTNGNLIRAFDAISADATMTSSNGVTALQFDGRGLLVSAAGAANFTITVCDSRNGERGRQITVAPTGRAQLNREFICP